MTPALALLAVFAVAASQGFGQSQAAPAFEVASVKLSVPGSTGPPSIGPPGTGRFIATKASLDVLLEIAFHVQQYQILGEPDWAEAETFEIAAKAEDGISLSYEQLKPRLQRLLAQRLNLATHREVKDIPGYALVVAKGGPKLKEDTSATATQGSIRPGRLRLPKSSMDVFAAVLYGPTGRPVVNKTGLEGNYEIELSFARDQDTDSPLPSIFTALQEQLGLKLEAQKVPVEMLVIDHVERVPTEN
ncbi:MAG TPA: TIGR03435 family protein [Bryobacteraceae bacterium]|nr:TIGR03435 family protein [Bryobacteraceae bacterium]